jgi:hypothetical protein
MQLETSFMLWRHRGTGKAIERGMGLRLNRNARGAPETEFFELARHR